MESMSKRITIDLTSSEYPQKKQKKAKVFDSKVEGTRNELVDLATRLIASIDEALFSEENERRIGLYLKISNELLEHPNNKFVHAEREVGGKLNYVVKKSYQVRNKDGGFRSRETNVRYKGATKVLRQVFYPDTSDNPIDRSKRNAELGGREKAGYNPKNMKSKCNTHGKAHGSLVHSQFEKITNMINKRNVEAYAKENVQADPCVKSFINYCIARKWMPLRSEFLIFDHDLMICTAIDMLAVDMITWELILIEFKTGYENEEYCMHVNDTKLQPPLNGIVNCPLNRHLLQVMLMQLILRKNYGVDIRSAYIVRICPKLEVLEVYETSAWCNMPKYKSWFEFALMNR